MTETHKEGGYGKLEAEIGVINSKPRSAEECWGPPEGRERQGKILLWSLQRKRGPSDTLILDFQPLETVEE